MNQNFDLEELIEESDIIIIGIGEEFLYPYNDYIKDLDESDLFKYAIVKNTLLNEKDELAKKYLKAYNNLCEMLSNKNYFIVSTVYDDLIYSSELKKDRITTPCGSIDLLHNDCECDNSIIDGKNFYKDIYEEYLKNGVINRESFPVCNTCKKPLSPNIITGSNYNEEGYINSWNNYTKFLQGTINKKLLLIELGVDYKTPTVIKWPFEKIAFFNKKSKLIRISDKFYHISEEIKSNSIGINMNSLEYILNYKGHNKEE